MSAGIGIAPHGAAEATPAADLLREADRQMYLAKAAGPGQFRPAAAED